MMRRASVSSMDTTMTDRSVDHRYRHHQHHRQDSCPPTPLSPRPAPVPAPAATTATITAAAAAEAPVEIDVDDGHSEYSDLLSNYSSSLVSSVRDYEFKHGRRYHSYHSGAYQFPNDEHEQKRLDLCHHMFVKVLDDRLFLSPIDPSGMRILDIGTGTGIWPIAMGDTYPAAELIVGNDLSPIQPQWAPPNVRFVVDDVEQDWHDESAGPEYDFIHCRYMCGSIQDWPRLLRQCFASLKPGGYFELQEPVVEPYSEDDSLGADHRFVELMRHLHAACEKFGRPLNQSSLLRRWFEDAGFTVVDEQRFKMPVGVWPKDRKLKEIGALNAINIVEGVEAFTAVPFTEVLGWTKEEVDILNEGARRDILKKKDAHMIYDYLVIIAQKPE